MLKVKHNHVIVIAEAGVNHNGSLAQAKMLVQVAADAGVDFVKFQTFSAEKLATKTAKKAVYQSQNIKGQEDSQLMMLKELELPESWHYELVELAKGNGIGFLSTGFDEESVDFLDGLGVPLFKVPSGEITNKPLLQHIARKGKPVILSTGMSNLSEVKEAIAVLGSERVDRSDVIVLHCNTEYPTPMEDVNLYAMKSMEKELNVRVGYSDHTLGIEVPIAAVALGACVIEKHFTLNRSLPGPDHKSSLEPLELKEMVKAIRNIELAISGSGFKEPSKSEKRNINVARKSIHLCKDLIENEVIKREHLCMKRPGDGISPMDIDKVVGIKVKLNLNKDDKLLWEHLDQ